MYLWGGGGKLLGNSDMIIFLVSWRTSRDLPRLKFDMRILYMSCQTYVEEGIYGGYVLKLMIASLIGNRLAALRRPVFLTNQSEIIHRASEEHPFTDYGV